jgi:hypothetical protein
VLKETENRGDEFREKDKHGGCGERKGEVEKLPEELKLTSK